MPKIRLTAAQRQADNVNTAKNLFRDAMGLYKTREHMSNKALAAKLGIGHVAVGKILKAETIEVSTDTLFRLLDQLGLELRQKGA